MEADCFRSSSRQAESSLVTARKQLDQALVKLMQSNRYHKKLCANQRKMTKAQQTSTNKQRNNPSTNQRTNIQARASARARGQLLNNEVGEAADDDHACSLRFLFASFFVYAFRCLFVCL
jgi:hypothetical protein